MRVLIKNTSLVENINIFLDLFKTYKTNTFQERTHYWQDLSNDKTHQTIQFRFSLSLRSCLWHWPSNFGPICRVYQLVFGLKLTGSSLSQIEVSASGTNRTCPRALRKTASDPEQTFLVNSTAPVDRARCPTPRAAGCSRLLLATLRPETIYRMRQCKARGKLMFL